MAKQSSSSKSLKSVLGAALLAIGFVFLFGNLDALEASANRIMGGASSSGMECLPALVLATTHVAQAYAFDHQGFLSVLQQILVSFWPLTLVMTGAALLGTSFGGHRPQYPAGAATENLGNR
jgi:hypothetical protein